MTTTMLVAALAVILIFTVSVLHAMKTAPERRAGPDARLTILVEPLDADPDDPVTTGLARACTDALLGRIKVFENCAVYRGRGTVPAKLVPRYRVTGSVHKDRDGFTIAARSELQHNAADSNDAEIPMPADASVASRAATAMRRIVAMRGWPFEQERVLRPGPPTDARDALGYLETADGRYEARIDRAATALRQSTDGFETSCTMLMLAAALAQARRLDEARHARADALAQAGAAQQVSSLRQNFYALPDQAWTRFTQGLEMAGMTP